jgi:hypothetical protein
MCHIDTFKYVYKKMSVRFFNFPPCRALSVLLLVLASLLLVSCGARRDGFDWGRFVLFSAVNGKVLDQGKPVPGLTLTRVVEWTGDTFVDTAVTDKAGGFAFPVLKKFNIVRQVLPAETRISQSIKTTHHGKDYEIWTQLKGNYDNNGELFYVADSESAPYDAKTGYGRMMADPNKVPITVTCDLATEVRFRPNGGIDWKWFESRGPKGGLGPYCLID